MLFWLIILNNIFSDVLQLLWNLSKTTWSSKCQENLIMTTLFQDNYILYNQQENKF